MEKKKLEASTPLKIPTRLPVKSLPNNENICYMYVANNISISSRPILEIDFYFQCARSKTSALGRIAFSLTL